MRQDIQTAQCLHPEPVVVSNSWTSRVSQTIAVRIPLLQLITLHMETDPRPNTEVAPICTHSRTYLLDWTLRRDCLFGRTRFADLTPATTLHSIQLELRCCLFMRLAYRVKSHVCSIFSLLQRGATDQVSLQCYYCYYLSTL